MAGGAPMAGSDPMAGGGATDPAATDMAAAPAEPAPDAATDMAANAPAEETTTADAAAPADAATGADANASADVAASLPGSQAEFVSIGEGQIRASTMLGKEVYGQDEESIGEVADLVLQDDGQTRAAIIDVGGFLGVGEKRVAVPFNEIQTAQEGDEVRLTVAMSREQLEQAPEYIEPDMTADSTDTATAPATDMAAGTDASGAPATDASGAPATDMAAAPADGQATDPNVPAQVQSDGSVGMEYELASQELTADNLIGTAVYSPNEENLGDVGDVVFDQAGSIQAVVIDVGGFLGIGEKPVAVQYDALNVQKGQNGDLRIVVNATQEQLEGAPEFNEDAAQ
jgi:sporulation protein YlmC with PRC-barrel domain